jgi:hypothetical protein
MILDVHIPSSWLLRRIATVGTHNVFKPCSTVSLLLLVFQTVYYQHALPLPCFIVLGPDISAGHKMGSSINDGTLSSDPSSIFG